MLGFLVADLLHRRDPDGPEGRKTRARASVVSAPSLSRHAAAIGLPDLLRVGRSLTKMGGRRKTALWADAFEAVIAAMYLDGGIAPVARLVDATFAADLENPERAAARDHKTALQEVLQGRGQPPPHYVVVAEEGPSHDRRFRVQCLVEGVAVSEGVGSSKKAAQQEAARGALDAVAPRAR